MTKPNNNEYDIKEYDIYLILLKIIEDKEKEKSNKRPVRKIKNTI